jgi:hypothetical protein
MHFVGIHILSDMNNLALTTTVPRDHSLLLCLKTKDGLVHLRLEDFEMEDWNELLESVSMHPSLRSLDLTTDSMDNAPKRDVTKASCRYAFSQ